MVQQLSRLYLGGYVFGFWAFKFRSLRRKGHEDLWNYDDCENKTADSRFPGILMSTSIEGRHMFPPFIPRKLAQKSCETSAATLQSTLLLDSFSSRLSSIFTFYFFDLEKEFYYPLGEKTVKITSGRRFQSLLFAYFTFYVRFNAYSKLQLE